MKIKKIHTFALSLLMLTACSSKKPEKKIESEILTNIVSTVNTHDDLGVEGDFAENYKLINFIERMRDEHNFDEAELYKLFSGAKDLNQVPIVCKVNKKGQCVTNYNQGQWDRYKGMFIYERNIQRGIKFWEEHENTLNRAYHEYGVLPEYIVGILGVETAYGVNFGKKKVIDVLTTKSMLNDRREDFYTKQLEKFLIMARDSNLDPSNLMGSDSGAMGYGQFIPSSYLDFAVDFNQDGVTDLWNPEDAIGSIANYFYQNGWKSSLREVAIRAQYKGSRCRKLTTGYKTKYSQHKLRKEHGIIPHQPLHYQGAVSLIKLPKYSYDELWLGTHNFRVITTYNHDTFYGMVVHQLGEEIKYRRYNN
ncbi:MAG: hypothetical protein KU29_07645 [Sulfurovum sp. FS06-10]|nr:MAG: hypothetical protein KU29_07645 [Sulfurovum sp. FS06-10]